MTGTDVDGQASVPVFSLSCDGGIQLSAARLFICSLSVHHEASFRPSQTGDRTNEMINRIRE